MSAIVVSGHAVEQFVSRHRPDLTLEEARPLLEQLVQTARRLNERACTGGWVWMLEGEIAIVARPDRSSAHERTWVIVTVLRPGCIETRGARARSIALFAEEIAAYENERREMREDFARAVAQREADAAAARLLAQRRESARLLLIEAQAGRARPSKQALARARALAGSDETEGEQSAPRRAG